MFNSLRAMNLVAISLLMLINFGCSGSKIPEQVPLSVVVLNAKGKPLNNVSVRFVPQIDGLDASFIANGTTDDAGRCELNSSSVKPGVAVCQHKVQITEAKASSDARAAYMAGDPSVSIKEKRSRKNRPIPAQYTRLATTPLLIDVTKDQPEVELVLE